MLTMLGPRIRVTNLSHEVPGAWARGLPTNWLVCFIQGHCAMRKEVRSGGPTDPLLQGAFFQLCDFEEKNAKSLMRKDGKTCCLRVWRGTVA